MHESVQLFITYSTHAEACSAMKLSPLKALMYTAQKRILIK